VPSSSFIVLNSVVLGEVADAFIRCRRILRHCATECPDGLPYLTAGFSVRPAGIGFAWNVFTPKLGFCLRGSGQTGGKFPASPIVGDFVRLFEVFPTCMSCRVMPPQSL
jgi:hypothetical protein